MAERLVTPNEPISRRPVFGLSIVEKFLADPTWLFQFATLLFMAGTFYWPVLRFLSGPHPLNPEWNVLSWEKLQEFLNDSWNLGVIRFSFYQAFLSAVLSVGLGLAAAWLQVNYIFPGRRWFRLLTFLPFVLPSIVVVLAMVLFYGNNGWINRMLMFLSGQEKPSFHFLYSLSGILIAHVYYNFPIAAKLIADQWGKLSQEFDHAARSLGAGSLTRFFSLTLPLLGPSMVSSFILIFLLCLNSFPIILVLGGGIRHTTMEVQIYQMARIELDLEGASALALLQAGTCLCILALLLRRSGNRGLPKTHVFRPLMAEIRRGILTSWLAGFLLLFLIAFTLGPLTAILVDSFRVFRDGLWEWSFHWYTRMISVQEGSSFHFALWNSVRIGLGGALISCLLGIGLSSLMLRLDGLKRGVGELTILFPMALSSVVFGISWFHYYHDSTLRELPLSVVLMAIHGILLCPYWVRIILPTLETVPPRWREESRVLGFCIWEHNLYIVLPWLKPTFLIAFFFSFALSLGELNSTLMVADETVRTLPLEIYSAISAYRFSYASATAVILLLLSIASLLLMESFLFPEVIRDTSSEKS